MSRLKTENALFPWGQIIGTRRTSCLVRSVTPRGAYIRVDVGYIVIG